MTIKVFSIHYSKFGEYKQEENKGHASPGKQGGCFFWSWSWFTEATPREQDLEEGNSVWKSKWQLITTVLSLLWIRDASENLIKALDLLPRKKTRRTYAYDFAFNFCGTLKCLRTSKLCRNCFHWEPCPCQKLSSRASSCLGWACIYRAAMETPDSLRAPRHSPTVKHHWPHRWDSFSGQRTNLEGLALAVASQQLLKGEKTLGLEEEDLGLSFISTTYSPCDLE